MIWFRFGCLAESIKIKCNQREGVLRASRARSRCLWNYAVKITPLRSRGPRGGQVGAPSSRGTCLLLPHRKPEPYLRSGLWVWALRISYTLRIESVQSHISAPSPVWQTLHSAAIDAAAALLFRFAFCWSTIYFSSRLCLHCHRLVQVHHPHPHSIPSILWLLCWGFKDNMQGGQKCRY